MDHESWAEPIMRHRVLIWGDGGTGRARLPVLGPLKYALLLALCLIAAPSHNANAEAEKLVVSNSDAGWLVWLADGFGLFDHKDTNVEVLRTDSGVTAVEDLIAGKADFATVSDFAFVSTAGDEKDLRIVASVATIDTVRLVIRTDRQIDGARDLSGHKIGLKKRSYSEFYLGRLLALNGLKNDAVDVVDIGPKALADEIGSGRVDGIVSWEPHAYESRNALGDAHTDIAIQGGHPFYFLLVTTSQVLDRKRKRVEAVIRALHQASLRTYRDEADAKAMLAKHTGISGELIERSWKDNILRVTLPQDVLFLMEEAARWRIGKGLSALPEVPDFLKMIDAGPLLATSPDVVTIIR